MTVHLSATAVAGPRLSLARSLRRNGFGRDSDTSASEENRLEALERLRTRWARATKTPVSGHAGLAREKALGTQRMFSGLNGVTLLD
jgi:hypothetical protein